METTTVLVGRRIKELRRAKNLSQDKLAEKIKIESKYLSRIETGRGTPSLDALENLANALNVQLRDLFDFEHLKEIKEVKKEIEALMASASPDQLKLLLRIFRAVCL